MISRRGFLGTLPVLALGCAGDGHFTLFGYTTKPPFDAGIRTVHVPVVKSIAFQTTPYRDCEVDLTSALCKEIFTRTPWRVSSNREAADTELLVTLVRIEKNITNRTPQNFARELEFVFTCQVVWRDLRTGKVLSNRRPSDRPEVAVEPFDPSLPPPVEDCPPDRAMPVTVVATGRAIPELGESNATGMKLAFDQMARQIVNMMECPW